MFIALVTDNSEIFTIERIARRDLRTTLGKQIVAEAIEREYNRIVEHEDITELEDREARLHV
jgi:hypothetical protein